MFPSSALHPRLRCASISIISKPCSCDKKRLLDLIHYKTLNWSLFTPIGRHVRYFGYFYLAEMVIHCRSGFCSFLTETLCSFCQLHLALTAYFQQSVSVSRLPSAVAIADLLTLLLFDHQAHLIYHQSRCTARSLHSTLRIIINKTSGRSRNIRPLRADQFRCLNIYSMPLHDSNPFVSSNCITFF